MRVHEKILFVLIIISILFACDRNSEKRKIKLSQDGIINNLNQQFTSTIHLEPKERRSIAVMFFQNLTGDQNLQWLQKGLTEMFIRALSQSSYLSILSTDRLLEILDRVGATKTPQDIDLDMAAIVGKEANVEAVILGQIKKKGGALSIHVKLQEPNQGLILKEESVEGQGLDAIFTMVDELTEKVKNDLQLTFEKAEAIRGISDITTNLLDAWREYAAGIDLLDKLLRNEATPHFEKAVALDSNFAAAMLKLFPLYLSTGKNDQAYQLAQKLINLKHGCTHKEQYEIDLVEAHLDRDDMKYLKTLEQWLKKFPEDRDAYMRMANVYRSWRNEPEEIKCHEKLISLDPKYKLSYNQMGYAYAYLGDFDKAILYINQYKTLAPDEVNPYDSAGDIYTLMGEYKLATQNYEQAIAINEDFLDAYMSLGHVYLHGGKYKKALQMYQKFLTRATNQYERSDGYFMLGQTYSILENYEKAEESYEKSLDENAFRLLSLDLLHNIYFMNNDSVKYNELLQNSYNRLKTLLNSETQRDRALGSIAWLSLFRNVNIAETIEIFKLAIEELEQSKNPVAALYLTNLKFILTLLYGKIGQYEKIDPLWVDQEIIPSELWRFLRDVHNNSYSDDWTLFGLLNTLFYNYPENGFEFYQPLIQYAKENQAQSIEMMFRVFLADLYRAVKDTVNLDAQVKLIGVPNEKTWMVIGPFDYKDGFRKKYPPEKRIKLNKTYKVKSAQIKWQFANDSMEDGYINFKEIFERNNWKVAYGLIYIDSPDEREVQFRFGSDDGSKVWLNDQEIWKLNRSDPAIFDDNKRTVKLNKGRNKVLIKVLNTVGDWGFFFRVTDENGIGIEDVRFVSGDENN
jgi:tetratricopeptide (TPR) repeat protein